MSISRAFLVASIAIAVAASPIAPLLSDYHDGAWAKGGGGGNGGGNGGGGNGGGGGGGSNGGGNGGSNDGGGNGGGSRSGGEARGGGKAASHGSKSNSRASGKSAKSAHAAKTAKAGPAAKTAPVGRSKADVRRQREIAKSKNTNPAAQRAGLNSLNRNYRALVSAADPRLSALSAYVTAYAAYEIANGVEPPVDDPVLGDAALATALGAASKTGMVTEDAISWGKEVLGIGPAFGKIDELRQSLELQAAIEANPPEVGDQAEAEDASSDGDDNAGDAGATTVGTEPAETSATGNG